MSTLVLGLAIAAVAVAVVVGLWLLESPAEQRVRRLDQRRVDDLQEIAQAVSLFRTRHDRLPESLDNLTREPGVSVRVRDPSTAEPYEFAILRDTTYRLCALFQRSTAEEPQWRRRSFWSHGAGRHCFELAARRVGP